jgi:anti-sigma factor RsiW
MSCENLQELISLTVDGKLPEAERENVFDHARVCRECGDRLSSLQTQRAILRKMAQAPMPADLAARLSVLASHERERQLARVSVSVRVRRLASKVDLAFENLMRPVALPVTGGLVSALLLFGLMVPTLSFAHKTSGNESHADAVLEQMSRRDIFPATFPTGQLVTNPYGQVDSDDDSPRIEPVIPRRQTS